MQIKHFISNVTGQMAGKRQQEREQKLYSGLLRHEAKIGGTVFGPIPDGTRREFFCLDKHTWIWHEEWTDKTGQHQVRTTRYDVRPGGILKSQNGSHYQSVSTSEANRLAQAAKLYFQKVRQELYNFV